MFTIRPSSGILAQPFWRALARGSLFLQQCAACRKFRHPPSPICPHCHSFESIWTAASGHATLNSFTEVFHPVHPSLAAAVPYIVTLVDLEEGVRMVSGVQDVPAERLRIGMSLRCKIVRIDEDFCLPFFQPTS